MDKRDVVIIRELLKDGRASFQSLGEKLGISRVAVMKRLKNLIENEFVKVGAMINLDKLGFKIVAVSIEIANYKDLMKLIDAYKDCPRMICLLHTVGGYNLFALMYAENEDTLMSVLDSCSIRTRKEVRRSEVVIGKMIYPLHFPICLSAGGEKEDAPCGVNCGKCERYMSEKCLGCPITRYYRPVWLD
ncbi:MAG: Lrp/AsnC family transcriptional regulator [Thermoproteota archaeon]|nr:MAG: Lrp/AsnC family transcriptional regulator [Candidatus Korarchaeota archaeon]